MNTVSNELPSGFEAGTDDSLIGCHDSAGSDWTLGRGRGANFTGANARSSFSLSACAGSFARLFRSCGSVLLRFGGKAAKVQQRGCETQQIDRPITRRRRGPTGSAQWIEFLFVSFEFSVDSLRRNQHSLSKSCRRKRGGINMRCLAGNHF